MPTPGLRHALKKALEPPDGGAPGARRGHVVVLGVGSELRSDDAAGVRVAAALGRHRLRGVTAMDGGSAPENCTAELRQLSPSHLVIVDCAQMGEAPGTVRLIEAADIAGVSFGTHALPLTVLADYVTREIGCRVTVIGIQPATIEFGESISPAVAAAVGEVSLALRDCLSEASEGVAKVPGES
jgi:hydrogenase 3 maturation protease